MKASLSKRLIACSMLTASTLSACASMPGNLTDQQRGDSIHVLLNTHVDSVWHAQDIGVSLTTQYLTKAQRSRNRRNALNYLLWAGSTATSIAAGTGAGRTAIVALSLSTQGAAGLDPLLNPGGTAAPGTAAMQTRCIANAGDLIATQEVLDARTNLKAYGNDSTIIADPVTRASISDTLNSYDTIKDVMRDGYVRVYGNYLTATTAPLLDLSDLPSGTVESTGSETPQGAESNDGPQPVSEESVEAFNLVRDPESREPIFVGVDNNEEAIVDYFIEDADGDIIELVYIISSSGWRVWADAFVQADIIENDDGNPVLRLRSTPGGGLRASIDAEGGEITVESLGQNFQEELQVAPGFLEQSFIAPGVSKPDREKLLQDQVLLNTATNSARTHINGC